MHRGQKADLVTSRPGSRNLRQLRRLVGELAPYRWQVAGALVALTLAAASVLSLGVGVRHLIDGGFAAGRREALDHALAAVVIVIVVLAVATFARSYLVTWLGERVVANIRSRLFGHVLRLSPGYYETTRVGEVMSRITADTSVVQTVIGASVTQALRNVLLLVGGLALLIVTNPRLTLLTLVVVPIVIVPIIVIGRRVRRLSRAAQDRLADVSGRAEEALNAIRTVQAFAQETREAQGFAAASERAFQAAAAYARARALLGGIVIALIFTAIVAVLWVGGRDVLDGRLTAGELSSFVFFALVVASAAGGLSEIVGDLQRAAGASERLFELLDTPPQITSRTAAIVPAHASACRVRFERVEFAYPSDPGRAVLRGLALDVAPGETVALVGPSGAGKTSILHLLMRFYEPQSGRILIDDDPLDALDLQAHRRRIGLVPQEPVIFSASARDNIAYGRPDASDAEIRAAAEAAAATEFLDRLPEGFQTFLGEKGVRLSGGQRQRVAIARAILCDPSLLLLDEATSSLDAESERLVQEALEHLMRGRTSIVVAHRLATVQRADRILVLDEGRIVEQGRHDDLARRGGLYARLATLQFGAGSGRSMLAAG
jgi:ATP-binding cassette subfamily B protein